MRFGKCFLSTIGADVFPLLRDAFETSLELIKILIPVSILVRILSVTGLIIYLGRALEPVMKLMGLPGSMGMVWAAGMANFYAGIVTFSALAPQSQLSVAQVTVILSVVLIAHSLPVELRISQKAGPRMRAMLPIRVGAAFLFGWIFSWICRLADCLQEPYETLWVSAVDDLSWIEWAQNEIRILLLIFVWVFFLVLFMKVLAKVGITSLLTKILEPVLRLFGMSRHAASVTIVGMILGLTYGGGLIIQESKSGVLHAHDVFTSLVLMNLSHGLIEDTILVLALGAHISGVLWGRLLFSFLFVLLISRCLRILPEGIFERYFFHSLVMQ
jgi:hypothetical protein